jgi:hemerythrin-like domain-containing protein
MSQPTDSPLNGFDALDVCHRQTIIALGRLAALMVRLVDKGADDEARALARQVVAHFSLAAREHHLDEELHVFPTLLATGDAETIQAVRRLQQDHAWLEEDWLELAPLLDAIAGGQSWVDTDILREGVDVFIALSHEHMALEESMIYPEARARLGDAARAVMAREMLERRRDAAATNRRSRRPVAT